MAEAASMLVPVEFTLANIINLFGIIGGTILVYDALKDMMPSDALKWFRVIVAGAFLFGIGQELGEAVYYSRTAPPQIPGILIVIQWAIGPAVFLAGAYMYHKTMEEKFGEVGGE